MLKPGSPTFDLVEKVSFRAVSNVPTNLSEKVVRNFTLKNGLVDIKVCAVDETWSGLKLAIPVKERKGKYDLGQSQFIP